MDLPERLFENNKAWAEETQAQDPDFFERLAEQQAPPFLWIGCSDSRVPATQVVGLEPGELFVHRNIANVVMHSDLSGLSVLEYAVDALEVAHILVCGHYGCGGVQAAAAEGPEEGLVHNWLRHVQDVQHKHADHLDAIADEGERLRRLCELNVIEQALNVCRTTVVQGAWERGQSLTVHGWIYGLADGRLRNLGMRVAGADEVAAAYDAALADVKEAQGA